MSGKFIFITGGVLSSLGKGITAAAIGLLLEEKGLKVAMMKLDPYLNLDPGTMSPYEHGEVYVTDDGAETDLDLGHYHRFTASPLSKASNATTGQIYNQVLTKERQGDFLGHTVQIIPHVTDEIKSRINACSLQEKGIDITIIEIGGTVGDIESQPFLEAIRQFRLENPNCINLHLTYVPYIHTAGEVKTKPTQHSVQMLHTNGIFPEIILCRCESSLSDEIKAKIGLFCSVQKEAVIDVVDAKKSIYEVPINLLAQNLDKSLSKLLHLPPKRPSLKNWRAMLEKALSVKKELKIAIVGKYVKHSDADKSVYESLSHAAIAEGYKIKIVPIEADTIISTDEIAKKAKGCSGILIPGGFGSRGWKGMITTAKYCRENLIPYFGICLGMHVMAVEFVRNVLGLEIANSTEMGSTTSAVIDLLEDQKKTTQKGGTMRLGSFPCKLLEESLAYKAYKKKLIHERHRHRYEFNNEFKKITESKGLVFSGHYEALDLSEIIELKEHPWMLSVQFHPEFKSKPTSPHPLFRAFIKAAIEESQ